MAIKTIEDLFIHELSDTYSAEKQMTKSLPRLAKSATDEGLVDLLDLGAEEAPGQEGELVRVPGGQPLVVGLVALRREQVAVGEQPCTLYHADLGHGLALDTQTMALVSADKRTYVFNE